MKFGMNLLLWTGHVTDEHVPVLNALKATRRYRISGQVLELFDDAGTRVARFAAQMPAGATKR